MLRLSRVSPAPMLGIALLTFLSLPPSAHAQQIDQDQIDQLEFRHIGPVGNRVSSVAGTSTDPLTYFAGAASGGIWKTEDGGVNWKPVFDDQPVHSIGALAVAPSDANVVWAGTGETFIRSNVSIGNGVWKSTDGGGSWTHMGLEGTGRIGRIVIHPTNPEVVYAAVLGHGYSAQSNRGVYRSTDGGRNWQQVLFVNDSTGASDLVMDPNNPRILFAGMWQFHLKTWTRESGGAGSGLYMSRDGGDTWKRLEAHGLPTKPVGKIALCMTPKSSSRVYALIETGDGVPWHGQETESGELWRSEDGGTNWKVVSHNRNLAGRSAYYSRCAVAPDDADEVYFLSASFAVTTDGGDSAKTANFFNPTGVSAPGWDHHDMWIDPGNANRMIVGHDGGVSVSQNRGKTWFRIQLPIAQMYHVTVDNNIPYYVYGNRQDGPSLRGPSRSRLGGFFSQGIPRGMWHSLGGGESGFATPDPEDPDIIWSSASGWGALGGVVVRYNERTRQFRQVEVWPLMTAGWPAKDVRYRFQWTFPLLISPHDHNTVYVTSQHVHRTTNGGQTWEVISPDLSTNDTTKQGISGGLTPDNLGVEYCCVIYAFDESPVERGVLWAGTSDGLVHVSRDNGTTWTNVTRNIRGLPAWGTVRNIDASKWDAGKAYLTVDFHEVGNFAPYVYKTQDYGRSWTKITSGIAEGPLSYARNIREDPVRQGLLYLGTENALYVSFDDGARWQSLKTNLPPAPVYWIAVQEHFNDLVIGTYGRGFWILDDVTPLQQLTPNVTASQAHLFEPRPAYRFRPITAPMTMFDDPSDGDDPEDGASINYWLATEPGEVKVRIRDARGDTVRMLDGTKEVGINRVWWDFRGEESTEIKLRTKPLYADWMSLGEDRWREVPEENNRISVLMPPGDYTVTLVVDSQEVGTQQLEVRKDPHSEGTIADIQAQTAMAEDLWTDMNEAAKMVNTIEWTRRQLSDFEAVLKDQDAEAEVLTALDSLHQKFIGVEEHLLQLRFTGTGQDDVRWPIKLVGQLGYLAGEVQTADFAPADQHREAHQVLKDDLRRTRDALDAIMRLDLPAFNQMLQERNLAPVIAAGSQK